MIEKYRRVSDPLEVAKEWDETYHMTDDGCVHGPNCKVTQGSRGFDDQSLIEIERREGGAAQLVWQKRPLDHLILAAALCPGWC